MYSKEQNSTIQRMRSHQKMLIEMISMVQNDGKAFEIGDGCEGDVINFVEAAAMLSMIDEVYLWFNKAVADVAAFKANRRYEELHSAGEVHRGVDKEREIKKLKIRKVS